LDHLVGGGQQHFRDGKAERLGGLVVENGMIKVVTPIDEMPAAKAGIMTKSSTTSRWLPSYVELLSCLELIKVRGGDPQEGRRRDALIRFALTHTPSRR
jgi:hypothetical protein